MINLNENTIVIDLPEGAKDLEVLSNFNNKRQILVYNWDSMVRLPPGEWEIFTPTEEDADELLKGRSYTLQSFSVTSGSKTAYPALTDFLRSLVESKGVRNPVYLTQRKNTSTSQ